MASSSDDREQAFQSLIAWFCRYGGYLHRDVTLSVSADGKGAGLALSTSVDAVASEVEQLIVACPAEIAFSILQIPEIAPWWPTDFIESTDTTILTRLLLIEAHLTDTETKFTEYIDTLPSPFDLQAFNTPLFWTDTERKIISGTNLAAATETREKAWEKELYEAKAKLQVRCPGRMHSIHKYDFTLYRWAASVLTSRCFPQWMVRPSGEADTWEISAGTFKSSKVWESWRQKNSTLKFPVLLPVFDMANHDPNTEVTWKCTGRSAELHARLSTDRAALEVYNNYGSKSNEELILGYGFDLSSNVANCFSLALPLGSSPKIQLVKQWYDDQATMSSSAVLLPSLPFSAFPASGAVTYGIRAGSDPLQGSVNNPLSILVSNSRSLAERAESPFGVPPPSAQDAPTQLGFAVAVQLLTKLREQHHRIRSFDDTLPKANELLQSRNIQMAFRYRQNQLEILEGAINSLHTRVRAWMRTGHVISVHDALTGITPSSWLRQYRSIAHKMLGTRNADKLDGQQAEWALIIWFANLVLCGAMEEEKEGTEDPQQGALTVAGLRSWLHKMSHPYRPGASVDSMDSVTRQVNEVCWPRDQRDDAETVAAVLKEELSKLNLTEDEHELETAVYWATRVVEEEAVRMPKGLLEQDSEEDGFELLLIIECE